MTDRLLAEQVAYYRARAPIYDWWWERKGKWDLGPEFNLLWQAEVERLGAALGAFAPAGDVLELAAGTGIWTARLAEHADRLTAVDASPEALIRNRTKLAGAPVPVDYVVADLFSWEPPRRFDVVAFGFWLTHVPLARFEAFWDLVDRALAPEGRVFFVDNAPPSERSAPPQVPRRWFGGPIQDGILSTTDLEAGVSVRRLPDGQEFRIVKVYWEPPALRARLTDLGWEVEVEATEWAFISGHGGRAPTRPLAVRE